MFLNIVGGEGSCISLLLLVVLEFNCNKVIMPKILFAGGGTGGSVSPLLALREALAKIYTNDELEFVWIGTPSGPEKILVRSQGIEFHWIFSGKLRRYFSWRNFVDPWLVLFGVIQSFFLLRRIKPDAIVSAGSFVAVPVAIAAWFLRVPILIHQQDIKPGLANKIIARLAKKITVSFAETAKAFPQSKVVVSGNPVRPEILLGSKDKAMSLFGLSPNLPIVLVIGGGTGALQLNKLVVGALPELLQFCQVVHITGKGKKLPPLALKDKAEFYHAYEFVADGLPDLLAAADLVISRAGLGFLTELSALGKPAMVIPIPNSHQEDNAEYFAKHGAVLYVKQNLLSSQGLVSDVKNLLSDKESLDFLGKKIRSMFRPQAADIIAYEISQMINV